MSAAELPSRARVVVVGGGVIGTSVAYHLAQAGESDVLLLERDRLTSGTTWHAAGLMTCFGSFSETSTRLRLYSRDLYARLEAETGQSTGFKPVGLVEAAADRDRLEEYRRVATFQRRLGLEVDEVSPAEMAELFPLARTDDLAGGFHVPGDGRVNPVDLTMALAKGARARGVRVAEGVRVEQVLTRRRGVVEEVTGVVTDRGTVECDVVVNAAGMWARELAAQNGVVVPNQAAEHYYLVTEPIDGMSPDAPVFEDPASYGYYREEGGGMMVGLFEPVAAAWKVEGIPRDFSFGTLPPDTDRVGPFLEKAMARVPVVETAGIRTFFCGPESFMPDLAPGVGEAPGIHGYFVCAGLNSVGILSAGGLGRILAHWVLSGRPDVDVTGIDVARFRDHQLLPEHRRARTAEVLGTVYAAHTPGVQLTTSRGVFRSPVHDGVVAAGGYLRDVSGWEGAAWYAGPGETPQAEPTWGRAPWFAHWEAEHRAVREAAGLFDMSFMGRFAVRGPDALAVLDRLSAGDLSVDGRITYTQWLADDGRLLADLTVTRLAADDLLVVASDTQHAQVLGILRRALGDADATVTDVTEDGAMLSLQGPASRAVLETVAPQADWSDAAFPFRAARTVDVDGTPVLAVRVTYVGELGWELYVPAGAAPALWDRLLGAGAPHGLRPTGLAALGSLRLEKGYRDYGHDVDTTDDVRTAGLSFAVAADKPGGFRGRHAVQAGAEAGAPRHRVVSLVVGDPEPLLFHGEVVLRDGVAVGDVRSGSYGWTVGGAVGLAGVEREEGVTAQWLREGTWEVDVAGTRYPAEVSLRPPYDPTSARVRG
ncbi:FAD-dependent oxidoreductase [Phycicoccus sp. MAQZ13P-2]|uniref:GcvT family protein n=1 Tax=Phycicoccus mangrovi TaxID=2840470 RepID=UPI001BFFEF0E|nr:FAD-dependent oxidoreductase [Phycicoccus mangrovi]MBT9254189.1 FAD-dependent oxidoreductase [Phycicoccus mangrovi]MBT9272567.1 FAD-dependent oxidoreductase [Phycicoccus mangrovi]